MMVKLERRKSNTILYRKEINKLYMKKIIIYLLQGFLFSFFLLEMRIYYYNIAHTVCAYLNSVYYTYSVFV